MQEKDMDEFNTPQMRAVTLEHPLTDAFASFFGPNPEREAIEHLSAMDDHMLRDIGIPRDEIETAVRTGRRAG